MFLRVKRAFLFLKMTNLVINIQIQISNPLIYYTDKYFNKIRKIFK